ncbi:MAG: DNA double-strand break repair nuclease NurA [Nitrososphaerota archaeon]|nr:DNA double-strand break repair nuclease NurA [Nitrososphaerota archaeon]
MMNNQLNLVPRNEPEIDVGALKEGLINLTGKRVLFRSDYKKEAISLQGIETQELRLPYEIRNFSTQPRERTVIGIDSSCVLIGETEEGSIFAGRVTTVIARGSKIARYQRAGPFIFYFSQKMVDSEISGGLARRTLNAVVADNSLAERFIRIRLERAAQIHAARTNTDAVILVDGSIRASMLESPTFSLKKFEREAEDNFNQILGVTKTSSIKLIAMTAAGLSSAKKPSTYCDLTDSLRLLGVGTSARILVARFSQSSQVFRVDASSANAEHESQVLADVKFNDVLFRGYPETLRLAHHLSVFDSATVSSIRGYLSKKYGLVQIPSDDLRATILGKFV